MNIYYEAKRVYFNKTGLGNYSRWLVSNYKQFYPEDMITLLRPYQENKKATIPFADQNYRVQNYSNFMGIQRSLQLYKWVPENSIFHGLSNELPMFSSSKSILRIVTIHDVIFKVRPNDYSIIDRAIYDFKIKMAVKNAHHIVAISQKTKNDLGEFYLCDPEKISVIYQNCDSIFYENYPDTSKQELRLKYRLPNEFWISVGSFNPRKNQISIVLAVAQIPEHLRIPIVFIGGGKTIKNILKTIHEYKVEAWFLFIQVETNIELAAIYQCAIGLIYPSLYEGFGIPAIEAIASGIPVIGHKGSAVEEAGGEAGVFIDMRNTEELAYVLSHLPHNSNKLAELKSKANAHLQEFETQKLMHLQHMVYKNTSF